MFGRLKSGVEVVGDSITVFRLYPKLSVPLLCCWLVYAPIVLYLKFFFPWDNFEFGAICLIVFLIILLFSFLFSCSCLVLLELLQQIESGKQAKLSSAFAEAMTKDLIKTLPITFVWAIIWFLLTLLQAIFSKKRGGGDADLSAENAARTLAGYKSISLSGAFFEALKKGVRMVVFLILPAIAWEDQPPFQAVRKGFAVLKTHLAEFATGFALTELAAIVVFLPPGLLFMAADKFELTLPDLVWYLTILYCAFAWTFSMFIEQMFSAELYLWHLVWERRCSTARAEGEESPSFRDTPRPSVLNGVPDLLDTFPGRRS